MDSRTFYATALKSGNRLQTGISDTAVKALQILPGDEVEIIIKKTGRTGRRNANAFKKKTEVPTLVDSTVATAAAPQRQVPEEIIKQLHRAKKIGMSVENIKESFNTTTEFKWEDLPAKLREELEKT